MALPNFEVPPMECPAVLLPTPANLTNMFGTLATIPDRLIAAAKTTAQAEAQEIVAKSKEAGNKLKGNIERKAKEQADDLKEVVKEQGKSAIKMVIDGLKNAREALNKAGDDMKESLQKTKESLQSEEIT